MAASVWETEDFILRLFAKTRADDRVLVAFNFSRPGVLGRPEWKSHLGGFWNRAAVKGESNAKFLTRVFAGATSSATNKYVFWEVVRQLGPFADFRFQMPEETAASSGERCFRAVFSVAGLAPLAVVLAQEVSPETVLSATSFLTRLVRNVGVTHPTLRVLDPKPFVQATSLSTTPPASSDGASTAPEGPDYLPDTSKTGDKDGAFFTSYLRALRALRQRELDSLDAVKPFVTTEDLLGDRVVVEGNVITVPTLLLVQPWFSPDAPRSYNYAGLGYAVVTELVRADIENQTRRSLTLPKAAPQAASMAAGCNGTVDPAGLALEALLRMLRSDGHERNRLRLPGSFEALNEEQLFFLAFCAASCQRRGEASGECNEVLRSTLHFGRTFRCLSGRYMNPQELSRCDMTPQPAMQSLLTGRGIVRDVSKDRLLAVAQGHQARLTVPALFSCFQLFRITIILSCDLFSEMKDMVLLNAWVMHTIMTSRAFLGCFSFGYANSE
ncbi:hypothetical protein HPB48_022692 [Haemaphysalis longicornis]|uniref:Uncharacterized protein n=1 Tax=Haemaphysalis longicornis TaxID=44386 RepID=A0A9J6GKD6_HAELO|nr:hypothetical protein HPB48_022692 [Haemaphysalis longicornis]